MKTQALSEKMPTLWWKKFFELNFAKLFLERDTKILQHTTTFLARTLHLKKNAIIFDQCCGTGDIAIALARTGFQTIGVEQNKLYIQIATEKADREHLPCRFFVGDAYMFLPKETCDAAINWYTSFGYDRDDQKNKQMLAHIYRSLKQGGYFALDYHNIAHTLKNFEAVRRIQKIVNGEKFIITRFSKIDLASGMLISKWEYACPDSRKRIFSGEIRTYFPSDLKMLLQDIGFRNVKFYGGIDGGAFTLESPRCIVVAQK